ncbi:unnamed protein product [Orchesella dallaii]|uniref:peptide-methionine (S)-S-oxide reductase n=1 Tax=Orchesella dallaii TaxID=48710 RepID=A0ABP1RQ85_9HEXA
MGKCCSKGPKVDIEKYSDFHQEEPPTPTNDCDKEFLTVKGENATFACGQMWDRQAQLSIDPGVIRTRVGYSTGKKMMPEFSDKFADHVAIIDIEFDPSKTSYENLLNKFWSIHDPTQFNEKPYHTKILYHNIDQKHAAENGLMTLDRKLTKFNYKPPLKRVRTDIEPAKHIFLASMENQHHLLQEDEFLSKVANCSTPKELVYSHLASKLNAFVSGYATVEEVEAQAESLGLKPLVVAYLKDKIPGIQKTEEGFYTIYDESKL